MVIELNPARDVKPMRKYLHLRGRAVGVTAKFKTRRLHLVDEGHDDAEDQAQDEAGD